MQSDIDKLAKEIIDSSVKEKIIENVYMPNLFKCWKSIESR